MVLIGQAIKSGIRIAGRLDRKYNLNKIFIEKYVPPGYRKTANRIVDIAGTIAGGYGLSQYLNAPETPGNENGVPLQKKKYVTKTYKSNKTRFRRSGCISYWNTKGKESYRRS